MTQIIPFIPKDGSGVSITPTTTSALTALGSDKNQVVITNTGTVNCHVRLVKDAGTATAADYIVLPNTQIVLTSHKLFNNIACISESGTGALHVILGEGF